MAGALDADNAGSCKRRVVFLQGPVNLAESGQIWGQSWGAMTRWWTPDASIMLIGGGGQHSVPDVPEPAKVSATHDRRLLSCLEGTLVRGRAEKIPGSRECA